jgi:hypothetical protein
MITGSASGDEYYDERDLDGTEVEVYGYAYDVDEQSYLMEDEPGEQS